MSTKSQLIHAHFDTFCARVGDPALAVEALKVFNRRAREEAMSLDAVRLPETFGDSLEQSDQTN